MCQDGWWYLAPNPRQWINPYFGSREQVERKARKLNRMNCDNYYYASYDYPGYRNNWGFR